VDSSGVDAAAFATRLLDWFRSHGRHDLPWQRDPSPYRVWVSEIMLQQTRVETVVPYFERFMARFPTLEALAAAEEDAVLALWSGLGYYSRARNLLRAARRIAAHHGGRLPEEPSQLMALPGIGRSTAGAIMALGHGLRAPILDGNVKRVLARHRGVRGWPGRAEVLRRLWAYAETFTPRQEVAAYTQAIMDLGATVCVRRRPLCGRCPVAADCVARREGLQQRLPEPRPAKRLPERETFALLVVDGEGRVLLERRPPQGVWGGLWSFPEVAGRASAEDWWLARLGMPAPKAEALPPVRHTFTHFRLVLHPLRYRIGALPPRVTEGGHWRWHDPAAAGPVVGLPAPVARLLERLAGRNAVT